MNTAIDNALARLVGRNEHDQQIFDTAVELLTAVTGWRFAAIGKLRPDGGSVEVLAACQDGIRQPPWSYGLVGTPCCDVYEGTIADPYWFVGENLAEKFPDDEELRKRGFVAYRGELFFDDQGNAAGHVFMMHDEPCDDDEQSRWFFRLITQRMGAEYNRFQMERTLAIQSERYARATTAGNVGVWEWNLETDEVYFAPNLERMLGCTTDEHIRHIDDWISRVDPMHSQQALTDAAMFRDSGRSQESVIEYRVLLADGEERWFEARAHPIINANGKVTTLVGTDTDITERKKIESEMVAARESAEQANRSKSEFLATMSHEFRTPLNAILGFSDLIRSEALGQIENAVYKEYINDIFLSGKHMLSLVNDVLDIAAIEAGKRQIVKTPLRVDTLLDDGIRIAESLAVGKKLDISVTVPAEIPPLHADERALTQIINNLLSNAVKFTGPGGRIDISARFSNDKFTMIFTDTGYGIAADQLEGLALPFAQARSNPHLSKDGTGLGLAIVKSLIVSHGGELQIDSEVGAGTTVTVTLPFDPKSVETPGADD